MVSIDEYLKNPCKASSIPYWKAREICVPDHIKILRHPDFVKDEYRDMTDTPYFRLLHPLTCMPIPHLPEGYSVCSIELREFAEHICSCYTDIGLSEAELVRYTTRRVYDPALWIAVQENNSGTIVATGIGELDEECREGILEWIQVSDGHRRLGLGKFLVCELLHRMSKNANFATVSGKCHDPSYPEKLYRKCGFTGDDIWHILSR